ncbi:zinc finger domain-containing protein [Streptomyces tanashiensis]|uniref:zinc finger domain-containing protein n=1 Tax=Streptomyces tanashiensis TaxID=67367 RepID=UPI003F59F62C
MDDVECHPCPRCRAAPGSLCRSRSGGVAGTHHTGRFTTVPQLATLRRAPTPADRGPGRPWHPGTPRPARLGPDTPSGRHPYRIRPPLDAHPAIPVTARTVDRGSSLAAYRRELAPGAAGSRYEDERGQGLKVTGRRRSRPADASPQSATPPAGTAHTIPPAPTFHQIRHAQFSERPCRPAPLTARTRPPRGRWNENRRLGPAVSETRLFAGRHPDSAKTSSRDRLLRRASLTQDSRMGIVEPPPHAGDVHCEGSDQAHCHCPCCCPLR